MTLMLLGLFIFLGVHSLRIVAPDWRDDRIAAWGGSTWKGVYSLLSIAGFVLLIWGYGQARQVPVLLWTPPAGLRHAVALLTLPAFILVVAAFVPGNWFKTRFGHPMVLGIKLWAFAHLLANGQWHQVLLFGSFMLWAMLGFRAARRREPASLAPANMARTLLSVVIGTAAWAGFAFYWHVRWIGVAPFG